MTYMRPSTLAPDAEIDTLDDLARALGGDPDFAVLLLRMICHADDPNRARLRRSYPRHVAAVLLWGGAPGTWTAASLQAALEAIPDTFPDPPPGC